MNIKEFENFLRKNIKSTGNIDNSIKIYCNAINKIEEHFKIKVFEINEAQEYIYVKSYIFHNKEFKEMNKKNDNTYSAALNHYEAFLYYSKLKNAKEINADKYNGIYKLERETIKQYNNFEGEIIDYKDADLIYLMTGLNIKIEDKKTKIQESHLDGLKKDYLMRLIDEIYSSNYEYKEIGLTTTGFRSFKRHIDESNKTYVRLIKIVTEVNKMANEMNASEEEIIEFVEREINEASKNNELKGTGPAVYSTILHLLAPKVFPIINGKQGEGTDLFSMLNIGTDKNIDESNYIKNVKLIKKYRDENFLWKNYRVLDEIKICKPEYLFVGARETDDKGRTIKNYTEEFIENKTWHHFFNEEKEEIKNIKVGTKIAIKYRTNIEKNQGYKISAIGTVYKNEKDGINLDVNWEKLDKEKGVVGYGGGIANTWYVVNYDDESKEPEKNEKDRKLIDFVFYRDEDNLNIKQENKNKNTEKAENDMDILKEFSLNMILQGPPGTGKTYQARRYAVAICSGNSLTKIENKSKEEFKELYNKYSSENQIVFTTFHQSYDYEDFVEGIRPELNHSEGENSSSSEIKYIKKAGVFKRICDEASKEENRGKNYVLIIDEINRGNISKIFGELITLIEENKRKGNDEELSAVLPYSDEFDEDKSFSVPKNLYIIGTMNTADRSIALMDTALRRRFTFKEIMPDASLLPEKLKIDGKDVNIKAMLNSINKRINVLYDKEHEIGHSYFLELEDEKKNPKTVLKKIFLNEIIPLLQEYFFDDYGKINLVLGNNNFIIEDYDLFQIFDDSMIDQYNIFENKICYKVNSNEDIFDDIENYIKIYSN